MFEAMTPRAGTSCAGHPFAGERISLRSALGASVAALMLAACGGGGGSSSSSPPPVVVSPPPPPPPPIESQYTAGEFKPSDDFRNICNPSGEKQFLRSFTNETYFWYDEVEDRDPTVGTESVADYFAQLKTFRTTASGKDVDEFHFSYTSEEYEDLLSGESFGYPWRLRFVRTSTLDENGNFVGRELRVLYPFPGGPVAAAGVERGAEILSIDGVSVIDGSDVDTLNAGLFPSVDGEEHTFTYRNPGDDEERTVTLQAGTFAQPDILATNVIGDGASKTAYVNLETFGTESAEKSLYDTFTELAGRGDVDDLVLDLRYNGGGFVVVACQLGYMIAGADDTTGRTCTQTLTNDKLPDEQPFSFRSTAVGFGPGNQELVPAGTPLPELDVDQVTVLTSAGTCSASELVMNGLNGIDFDISQVGTTTCGKPFGFTAEENCGMVYFTVQFQSVNNEGFGDYADGFTVDEGAATNSQSQFRGCAVADDFVSAFGDPADPMVAAALQFQDDGTCPADATASAKVGGEVLTRSGALRSATLGIIDDRPGALGQEPRIILRRLLEEGLITRDDL